MDHDGTKNGFANEALKKMSKMLNIPVIASGGAGNEQHFIDTFKDGEADAALLQVSFALKIEIVKLKQTLQTNGIPVRLDHTLINNMSKTIDFNKSADGLVPAIVQDAQTKEVLMLGYMDEAAYTKTIESQSYFFSRSKKIDCGPKGRKWKLLKLGSIDVDCDKDTPIGKGQSDWANMPYRNRYLLGKRKYARLWIYQSTGTEDCHF